MLSVLLVSRHSFLRLVLASFTVLLISCGVEMYGDRAALIFLARKTDYKSLGESVPRVAKEDGISVKSLIDQNSMLYHAARHDDPLNKNFNDLNWSGVRWFLENNADIKKAGAKGLPTALLETAITDGKFSWEKDLGDGNTMLHASALGGNLAAVNWLITKIDFNLKNDAKSTPLNEAIRGLEADLKLVDKTKQRTKDYCEIIKKLLGAGADTVGVSTSKEVADLFIKEGISLVSSAEILQKLSCSLQAIANP